MSNAVCKFHIESVEAIVGAPAEYPGRIVTLWASYDPALLSDYTFSDTIPSGRLEAQITNPAALALFLTEQGLPAYGKELYLILTTEKPE